MNTNISYIYDGRKAFFHLPGLFEFYEFYKVFLPLFYEHREYFYDWCDIGSIYGAPADCLWGGGRAGFGDGDAREVFKLMSEYKISARLTFSNSLLKKEHLSDKRCNELCELLSAATKKQHTYSGSSNASINTACKADGVKNGIIVHSDLLLNYLKNKYPDFYFVSSTTKVLTDYNKLLDEINKEDFSYVVPDFRLNKCYNKLETLTDVQKNKVEFLCNECCWFECYDRSACYEAVSRMNLGESCVRHICVSPNAAKGYSFSGAMSNPAFISINDIRNIYLPMGFTNFKIEGRSLGSALILEFILYYMTKPQFQIHVREAIYLDNMLDLF